MKFREFLNEGNERDIIKGYAKEIIAKIDKEQDFEKLQKDERFDLETAVSAGVRQVLTNLGHDESNPNFKKFEKYMPKNFDKSLVKGSSSFWLSMSDAKKDTIIRQALEAYLK